MYLDLSPPQHPRPHVFSTDWFWQNTAGASTQTRKEQTEPQICFKHWISRCCWKSWILLAVPRSQRQRGKKSVMPSGSTWRRHISDSASKREMVEGFLFSTCIYLSLLDVVRVLIRKGLWSFRMSWSWPVMTCIYLYGFKMNDVNDIPPLIAVSTCFRQIDGDETLQVLRQSHASSRWRRRFVWSLESVDTAGRVGFEQLLADPSRGVAKSS